MNTGEPTRGPLLPLQGIRDTYFILGDSSFVLNEMNTELRFSLPHEFVLYIYNLHIIKLAQCSPQLQATHSLLFHQPFTAASDIVLALTYGTLSFLHTISFLKFH